jgi:hypothetical protein
MPSCELLWLVQSAAASCQWHPPPTSPPRKPDLRSDLLGCPPIPKIYVCDHFPQQRRPTHVLYIPCTFVLLLRGVLGRVTS